MRRTDGRWGRNVLEWNYITKAEKGASNRSLKKPLQKTYAQKGTSIIDSKY